MSGMRRSMLIASRMCTINVLAANTSLIDAEVIEGDAYNTQIVVDEGYSIYEITIKMGGVDITSTAYDATYNMISIASVTDDVDIVCYAMHTMPSDYIRVDGIKNPSTAYLDTGYKVTPYSRLEVSPVFDSVGVYPFYMICGRSANSTTVNGSGLYIQNAYLWYMHDKSQTKTTFYVSSSYYGQAKKISIDYYTKKWAVEGASSGGINAKVNNDTFNTCLFSGENGYRPQDSAGKIIKFAAIYDHQTNAYVRYYIPCLNASGVAGFWDAARGVFRGSSNSTAFEAVAADGGDFRLINFEDSAVKNICVTNWGGHYKAGEMYTPEARAVTAIGAQFRGNTTITKFNEFKYFTNVNSIPNSSYTTGLFSGCNNLLEVSLPPLTNVTNFTGLFNDCYYLETVDFSLLTERTVNVNISRMFGSCGIKEVDLRAFKNINYLSATFIGTTPYVRLTKIITTGCNFSAITADSAIGSAFYNSYALNTIEGGLTGLRRSVDLRFCPLSVESATEVLTSLSSTPVSGAKITLRNGSRSTYEANADFNAAVTAVTNNGWTVAY